MEDKIRELNPTKETEDKKIKKPKEKKHSFLRNLRRDDSPFKNFISILIGYADTVVLYNIFFLLTSLGIVTIGPGLVSIVECYNDFVGNKTEKRYRRYFKYLKKNFNLENSLLGIIFTGLIALIFYLFVFFLINTGKYSWLIAPWILANVILFYLVAFVSFYILMRIRIYLPIKTVINNSLRLAAGAIKSVIGCLVSFGVFILVPFIFLEYAFPLLILISFTAAILGCTMSVYKEVDKLCIYSDADLDKDLNEIEEKKANLKLDMIDKDFLVDEFKKEKEEFSYYEVIKKDEKKEE